MDWTAWGGLPPCASQVASAKYKWSLHLSEEDPLNTSKRESGPARRPLPRDKSPRLVPDNMKFQTSHTIPFMQTGAIIQAFPCTPGLDFAKFEMDDEPSSNLLEHYGSAPPQSAVRFSPGHGPAEGYDSILTEAPRSRSGMDMASMDMSSMLAADTNSHAEGASLEWLQAEMQDLVDAIQEIAEVEASGVQVDPRFLDRHRRRVDGLLKQIDRKECQYQQSSGILERQASDDEEEAMSGQMRTVELLYREDDAYGRKQYIGQIRDGLRHGLGVMRWTDGAKYEGEWRDDKPSGFAVEFYGDDSSYAGQFLNDERHGLGSFRMSSGDVWSGHWEVGERHGPGFVDRGSERAFVFCERGRKTDTKMDQISTAAMSSLLADTLRAATNAAGLARMLASNFASAKQDVANDSMQARQLNFDSDVVSPIKTISSPSDLVEEPFLNAPTRGAAGTPGGKSWLELQWDLLQALGREARRLDELFQTTASRSASLASSLELEGDHTLPSKKIPALYGESPYAAPKAKPGPEASDPPASDPTEQPGGEGRDGVVETEQGAAGVCESEEGGVKESQASDLGKPTGAAEGVGGGEELETMEVMTSAGGQNGGSETEDGGSGAGDVGAAGAEAEPRPEQQESQPQSQAEDAPRKRLWESRKQPGLMVDVGGDDDAEHGDPSASGTPAPSQPNGESEPQVSTESTPEERADDPDGEVKNSAVPENGEEGAEEQGGNPPQRMEREDSVQGVPVNEDTSTVLKGMVPWTRPRCGSSSRVLS